MEKELKSTSTELIHFGEYDLLLNRTATDPEKVTTVYTKVLRSIFDSGLLISGWAIAPGIHKNIWYDTSHDPQFMAKEKWLRAGEKFMNNIISLNRELDPVLKSTFYACNSLLNEISLSPHVKKIVSSEAAQKIAHAHGFSSLTFVEPLLGVIDRQERRKYLFYEYVDALTFRDTDGPECDALYYFSSDLADLIHSFGISPHDLDMKQIMYKDTPKGKLAFLTDIEAYHKIK